MWYVKKKYSCFDIFIHFKLRVEQKEEQKVHYIVNGKAWLWKYQLTDVIFYWNI